jgi:hypothetical protein
VFSELAFSLMKDVLKELEIHCLSRDCGHFALVISTFALLFMAVESIQYHAAKDPYHSSYDPSSTENRPISTGLSFAAFEESEGVNALLNFYKACFSGCHSDRILSVPSPSKEKLESPSSFSSASSKFVAGLRFAVEHARQYVVAKNSIIVSAKDGTDIHIFFDRLLARLFLLDP